MRTRPVVDIAKYERAAEEERCRDPELRNERGLLTAWNRIPFVTECTSTVVVDREAGVLGARPVCDFCESDVPSLCHRLNGEWLCDHCASDLDADIS